eukprot:CAMPEP_0201647122 /NCGR_PEP_ID=MMETSP0493-20130528/35177_1 /ASSEMBLY_ACC=CAM_ASM_000838 /TAXON_ID=420259 /ORGANISM="Thalassiosira gravida, Strain GMp14c1" /LENGTH=50 /DNA_ID=CAMNT_0048122443 /DNA_START=59 /DNA_END=211 /DNA_ORIENTATION=-
MNPQNEEEDGGEELNLQRPGWRDSEWVPVATNALVDNTSAAAITAQPPPS